MLESLIWGEIILKVKAFQVLGPVWGKGERHHPGQEGCGDKRVRSCSGRGQWGNAEVACGGGAVKGSEGVGAPSWGSHCWLGEAVTGENWTQQFQSPNKAHLIFFSKETRDAAS